MSMVTICIIVLIIALICLVVEMFIPGFGFFGISGLILMAVSAVLAIMYIPYGWVFVTAQALVIIAFVYLIYRRIRNKQLYSNLIMSETLQEDIPAIGDLDSLIGKEGQALTTLRPFGEAGFNGRQLEVCSDGPYIERGAKVKVTEIRNSRVMVTEIK